jgi:hypothetical protein
LLVGRHRVTIKHEKESYISYLRGSGGCIPFEGFVAPFEIVSMGGISSEQGLKSFELVVEADHSYIPVTRRHCSKNWIWIVDSGRSAKDDLVLWKKRDGISDYYFQSQINLKNFNKLKVVAGQPPPAQCE